MIHLYIVILIIDSGNAWQSQILFIRVDNFLTSENNLRLDIVSSCLFFFPAFSIRLFSVLRYESMIHEFDPYFNYRTTKFLADEGFYNFHNWWEIKTIKTDVHGLLRLAII